MPSEKKQQLLPSFTLIMRMVDGSHFEMTGEVGIGDSMLISSEPIEVMRGGGFGYIPSVPRLKMDVMIGEGKLVRPGKRHARKKTRPSRRGR